MGKFVFVSNQKIFKDTKPPHFNPTKNLHSIIDTKEIFIETTKDHKDQRLTWPSYKHHNTIEILAAAAPNSSIIFVSKTTLIQFQIKPSIDVTILLELILIVNSW